MNRFLSVVLLAAMVLSLLPGQALAAGEQYGYLVINNSSKNRVVNFRHLPNTNDNTNYPIAQIPEFWVVEILGDVTENGIPWKQVRVNVNTSGTGAAQYETGYIMASFVQAMTAAEQTEWLKAPTSSFNPAPASVSAPVTEPAADPGKSEGYVRTIVDKVNLRKTPAGKVINENNQIPLGTVLAYYVIEYADNYHWAKVVYNGMTGYIRTDCIAYSDASGNLTSSISTPSVVVVDPTSTALEVNPSGTYGKVLVGNVLFRKKPSTSADFWTRLPADWIMEVLGTEVSEGIKWYKVRGGIPTNRVATYTGYIHQNFFTLVENPSTSGSTSTLTLSKYAVVTVGGTNMRQTPGGATVTALAANKVVNVISAPSGNSANDWYYVELNGSYGYLPATSLRVLYTAELSNYTLPAAPSSSSGSTTPATGGGYVKLILDKVNIRKTPGGTSLTPTDASKLAVGTILAYTGAPEVNGNYTWVLVTYKGITGYVRSDCYTFCDAAGTPVAAPAVVTPDTNSGTNSGTTASQGYIKLIRGGVNVRTSPWGASMGQLDRYTVLPYFSVKKYLSGNEEWYEVYASQFGSYGYILSTMAVVCNADGSTGVIKPSTPVSPVTTTGYVATSASSVWLRAKPETDAETVGQVAKKGTVLKMAGSPVKGSNNQYTWYPVQTSNGVNAFIRGDFAYQLADWQITYYNQHGTAPTPTPGPQGQDITMSTFIQLTADKVYLRATPSTMANTFGQVNKGTVLQFFATETVSKITWYKVLHNGQYAWIHGNFAKVLTNAEYEALSVKPTATAVTNVPTATSTAIVDSSLSDMAITTSPTVRIRASASMTGKELVMVNKKGTALGYLGQYVADASGTFFWFNVSYKGVNGWMHGNFVKVLTKTEKQAYEATGTVDTTIPTTFRNLSKGSTGDDVKALQEKLVKLGYLAANQVSGSYLTTTENAVIAFQKANKLTVDGIAGQKTQAAIYAAAAGNSGSTTPSTGTPGANNAGSSTVATLYPVEKIDWYTGGIRSIWAVGKVAVITDVYTGISFRAQRLYGDNHADCEPLTTADTAAICKIYGVSTPQQISDQEQKLHSYRRRPLWVTIGGRTFAASMYGIPHNYDGDRIADNGYNGQFCVHFTNSRTHTTNIVDPDASYNDNFGHQSAIQYAYTHSISGTK